MLKETLIAARQWIANRAEDSSYGFFTGGDPRLFTPDAECSTSDEIAAHKAACEAWDRGERPEIKRSGRVEHISLPATDKHPAIEGPALVCGGSFGMGVQTYRDEEALALIARLDAMLEPTEKPETRPAHMSFADAVVADPGAPLAPQLGAMPKKPALYFLVTTKHRWDGDGIMFWGPDSRGYTPYLRDAGRYTDREAARHVNEHTFAVRCANVDAIGPVFRERDLATLRALAAEVSHG